MADKAEKQTKKAVKPPTQSFFVPSIEKTIEAIDLSEVEAIVAKDKTNQEEEVGDGNS
jgi:hypothetical protein